MGNAGRATRRCWAAIPVESGVSHVERSAAPQPAASEARRLHPRAVAHATRVPCPSGTGSGEPVTEAGGADTLKAKAAESERTLPAADSGRQQRFTSIFNAHYGDVVAYARRRTRTDADAEDVANDTFAVAWRRLDEIRPDVPLAWLYGIARRVVANRRRGERRQGDLLTRIAATLRPDNDVALAEPDTGSSAVLTALSCLSPSDQELLRLVAWEALSHAEIAVIVGASPGAVAVKLHRARQRLSRQLAQQVKGAASVGHIDGEGRLALPPEED